MLGIDDPLVWLAYILCPAATGLSLLWGLYHWNENDERLEPEDRQWAQEEREVENEL